VILKFTETSLSRVLDALAAVAGFEVRLEGADPSVRVDLGGPIPLREALARLKERFHLRYRVSDPDTLIVEGPYLAGTEDVTSPRLVEGVRAKPVYPERARNERISGRVLLQAVITPEGRVEQVETLTVVPEGFGFEEAAIEAVRQWRYEPATRGGIPVSAYFTVKVDFDLK